MNQGTLEYKGYTSSIGWSDESGIFVGKVTNLDNGHDGRRHVITFTGKTLHETQEEFKGMIDWYLQTCERDGIEPSRPAAEAMARSV